MTTLTTIGDTSSPVTDLEHVFTGLTFIIGVFVFAAVVGNVGDVISSMNAARQDFISRMDQIKFYMDHRRVPEHIQNRVKRWADYSWVRTQAIDEFELLQMLPDRLRTEIAISVHLDTLRKVTLFEKCEDGLLHELVLKLRPQIYSPGDYICRIDEIGREMYIINNGKVEILVASPSTMTTTVVATLTAGNYFGEISLLKLDGAQNRRTADVRSVGYSELLRLSRKDLNSALAEYPNAKEHLEEQARARMQETQQVRRSSNNQAPQNENNNSPHDAAKEPAATKPKLSLKAVVEMKKKSKLADFIKSDVFQKMLSSRGNEVKELKDIISELRQFDSFTTKNKISEMETQCEKLKLQLNKYKTDLDSANQRVAELELSSNHTKLNGYTHVSDSRDQRSVSEVNKDPKKKKVKISKPDSSSYTGYLQRLFPHIPKPELSNQDSSSTESLNAFIDHVHNGVVRRQRSKSSNIIKAFKKVKPTLEKRRWSTDSPGLRSVKVPGISINDIIQQKPVSICAVDGKIHKVSSKERKTSLSLDKDGLEHSKVSPQTSDSLETDLLDMVVEASNPTTDASTEGSQSVGSTSDLDSDESDDDISLDDIYIDSVD